MASALKCAWRYGTFPDRFCSGRIRDLRKCHGRLVGLPLLGWPAPQAGRVRNLARRVRHTGRAGQGNGVPVLGPWVVGPGSPLVFRGSPVLGASRSRRFRAECDLPGPHAGSVPAWAPRLERSGPGGGPTCSAAFPAGPTPQAECARRSSARLPPASVARRSGCPHSARESGRAGQVVHNPNGRSAGCVKLVLSPPGVEGSRGRDAIDPAPPAVALPGALRPGRAHAAAWRGGLRLRCRVSWHGWTAPGRSRRSPRPRWRRRARMR